MKTQCGNCAHAKLRHVNEGAHWRCLQGITEAAWESEGGCPCTGYVAATVRKVKR